MCLGGVGFTACTFLETRGHVLSYFLRCGHFLKLIWLDQVANRLQGSAHSCLPRVGLQVSTVMPDFYMDAWDLNSDLLACTQALPSSPQPQAQALHGSGSLDEDNGFCFMHEHFNACVLAYVFDHHLHVDTEMRNDE